MARIIDDFGYRIKIPDEEFLALTLGGKYSRLCQKIYQKQKIYSKKTKNQKKNYQKNRQKLDNTPT